MTISFDIIGCTQLMVYILERTESKHMESILPNLILTGDKEDKNISYRPR